MKTADAETRLTLAPEQEIVREDDLVYIRMKYTDFEGEWKPMIRGSIRVTVDVHIMKEVITEIQQILIMEKQW